MAEQIIDSFFVEYLAKFDKKSARALKKHFRNLNSSIEQSNKDLDKKVIASGKRRVKALVSGVKQWGVAAAAAAAQVFRVGMRAEEAFSKLRTQLGETFKDIGKAREHLKGLSRETGVPLDELARAFFSLRSAGVPLEAALIAMDNAARSAAIGLGDTQDVALLAGGIFNSLKLEVKDLDGVFEAIHKTIKFGNIKDAGQLAAQWTELNDLAGVLKQSVQEIGASIAVFTRSGLPVPKVITGIRAAMAKLAAPTQQGLDVLGQVFPGVGAGLGKDEKNKALKNHLQDLIESKGQLQTIKTLADSLKKDALDAMGITQEAFAEMSGERQAELLENARLDTLAFKRFFEDVTGMQFALNVSQNFDQYMEVLENMRKFEGTIAQGQIDVQKFGFDKAKRAMNDFNLFLDELYNKLSFVLGLFMKLPPAVRNFVIAFAALKAFAHFGFIPKFKLFGESLKFIIDDIYRLAEALFSLNFSAFKLSALRKLETGKKLSTFFGQSRFKRKFTGASAKDAIKKGFQQTREKARISNLKKAAFLAPESFMLMNMIESFKKRKDSLKGSISGGFRKTRNSLKQAGPAMKNFFTGGEKGVNIFKRLFGVVRRFASAFVVGIGIASKVLLGLISILTIPAVLIGGIVAALIASYVYWDQFRNMINTIWELIKTLAQWVGVFLILNFKRLRNWLLQNPVLAPLVDAVSWLFGFFPKVFEKLGKLFDWVSGIIQGWIGWLRDDIESMREESNRLDSDRKPGEGLGAGDALKALTGAATPVPVAPSTPAGGNVALTQNNRANVNVKVDAQGNPNAKEIGEQTRQGVKKGLGDAFENKSLTIQDLSDAGSGLAVSAA